MSTDTINPAPVQTCSGCNGVGKEANLHSFPSNTDSTTKLNWTLPIRYDGRVASDIPGVGEFILCYNCKGDGYTKKHHNGRYKTPAMLANAIKNKTGERCYACAGSKQTVNYPVEQDCYDCSGNGLVPAWVPGAVFAKNVRYDAPKPLNPDGSLMMTWSDCDHMDKAVAENFAANVTVKIFTGGANGFTMLTGYGSICAVTDYGRLVDQIRAEPSNEAAKLMVETMVRNRLREGRQQWINLIDKVTGVMTDTVSILIDKNGYVIYGYDLASK